MQVSVIQRTPEKQEEDARHFPERQEEDARHFPASFTTCTVPFKKRDSSKEWAPYCQVYTARYILPGIYCQVYIARYLLPGIYCQEYTARSILLGIYCQVYTDRYIVYPY